jgi:hypothetical protein
MALSWLTSESSTAAITSAVITVVGLLSRFAQRRLASSSMTITLFITIVLISAGVADLVARIPTGGKVGLLGAGTGVPFWTQTPGTGGHLNLKTSSTKASKVSTTGTHLVGLLWFITGYLTGKLDRRLSNHKWRTVAQISQAIATTYHGTDLALRLQRALRNHVDGLTDVAQIEASRSRLALAFNDSKKNNWDIGPIVQLAYDWKIEDLLVESVRTPVAFGGR